jgi:hypothetical protein
LHVQRRVLGPKRVQSRALLLAANRQVSAGLPLTPNVSTTMCSCCWRHPCKHQQQPEVGIISMTCAAL